MKKIQILTVVTFLTISVSAQDSKLSATLGYPFSLGDNFLADFTGVADLGVQYRIIQAGVLDIGLSANGSYYVQSTPLSSVNVKENVILVQPRVFMEINMETLKGFRPSFGLGYSFLNSKVKYENAQNQPGELKDYTEGLNASLGLAYDITSRIFAFLSYDYIKVNRDNPNQDNDFFRNGSILKLGAGFRF
ncbi:outer membrane beta-barrel protein [Muricauda sp. NFXS6]|uniref:outer membrane beta-barrel protein n=1 Tax=Allomuricauda sp. NFXS6 TaxID=2819094 RepID=UPI0032DFD699